METQHMPFMTTADDNLESLWIGKIVFDVEYNKIKRVHGRVLDDIIFDNAKICCKISNILNDIKYLE